jgi:hypothetical protein
MRLNKPGADALYIEGRYGLVQSLDEEGRLPVAQAGFSLVGDTLKITNSPQGLTREKLAYLAPDEVREILRELRKGTFRDNLMIGILQIGRAFRTAGVREVTAVSAEHHDKVDRNGGPLAFERALKSMNDLYERHGFIRNEDGDYSLVL